MQLCSWMPDHCTVAGGSAYGHVHGMFQLPMRFMSIVMQHNEMMYEHATQQSTWKT